MATQDTDFESKLVDYSGDKYSIVVLASMWTKVLKRKQEYKNMTDAAIIKIALDDILSGKVTREQVITGSSQARAQQRKEEEEARKEAERKAKEPLKL